MARFLEAIIFCLFFPLVLYPQSPDIKFEHISVEQGLSSAFVKCIFQDNQGFIWFGTENGLDKFDGYRIISFKHNPEDSNSISDNIITTIHEDIFPDKHGNKSLWIGTWSGGLSKFNTSLEKWTHYKKGPPNSKSISNNSIYSLVEDKNGILWIGTRNGLNRFNRENEEFTCYKVVSGDKENVFSNIVLSLHEESMPNQTGKRMLWVGTVNGLYSFDRENEKFLYHLSQSRRPNITHGDPVTAICEDKSGMLWIGTDEGEVHRYDRRMKKYIYNKNIPDNPNKLNSNYIRSIYIEKSGIIWIGSDIGLYRLEHDSLKKEYLTLYENEPNNSKSLNNNIVTSVYKDRSDILWIGTLMGVNKCDLKRKKFRHYKHKPENQNSLSNNRVKAICEDKNGVLWISAWDSGLNRFDRQQNKWTLYQEDPQNTNSLCRNKINDIYESKDGSLWIATILGLNKFDIKDEKFWHYQYERGNPNSLRIETLTTVYEDNSGLVWIGCVSGVLTTFNPKFEQFQHYKNKSTNPHSFPYTQNIHCIYEDKSGSLWFGTDGSGIARLDQQNRMNGIFTHYKKEPGNPNSLVHNTVLCIYEDKMGTLCFGTKGGFSQLNKKDKEKGVFTNYRIKDGLPNEVVCSILEDDKGFLWLSTFNGLSKFNPQTKTFRNYDVDDGLQSQEFNNRSSIKSKSGELIFGGNNGFNIFHSDSILDNKYIPPIVITDFQIFNESIHPGGNSPLLKSVSQIREIILSHKYTVFSFEFAALDYKIPQKNQYAYKMEGVDPDWVYADASRRFATYTNLDPGEYTFRVKGSNNDGLWNEEGTSIKITITPPWWQTNLAYALYLLLFGSIVFATWLVQLRRIRLKQQLKMEHFEAEKLREVDQLKSRFFANISHEFRTPLTLIKGPVKQMLEGEFFGNVKEQYKLILRNSDRLLALINQILDLSKLELGEIKLQIEKTDIIQYLKGLVLTFSPLADRKKVTLKFISTEKLLTGYIDRDKLEKIVTNLLSNAFKFTPEGGEIILDCGLRNADSKIQNPKSKISSSQFPIPNFNFVEITISNTGPGILTERLDKIFDRFYQADDNYKKDGEGTGIGLALTKELVELHHGTINVECGMAIEKQPPKSPPMGGSPPLAGDPLNRGEAYLTTFTILLPIYKDHFTEDEIIEEMETGNRRPETGKQISSRSKPKGDTIAANEIKSKSPIRIPDSGLRSPLLLIVEDNPDFTEYISSFMKNDYRILITENGKEGLKMALDKYPDLIISDVMMPEMDGFELCKKLKTDQRTSHIPVILLTAKADLESKIEGLEYGADDYISKPFEADELKVRSKNLIDSRIQLRRKFSRLIDIKPGEVTASSMDEQFLERLMMVSEKHLSESGYSTENLAREVGISRSQLNRKLKALTDLSTHGFILNIRLKRAAQLLKKKAANVTEIAYTVGFNSPANFSKAFKNQYGKSPRDFIKENI